MKILITGNLGYIGPVLSEYLNKNYLIGYDAGFFHKNSIFKKNKKDKNINNQIFGDIRKIKKKDLNKVDAVIHLAAISNDPMGNQFIKATEEINVIATKRLIKLCIASKVKSFVFASSCSTYGNSARKNNPKKEFSFLNPLTYYAKSKVKIENFAKKINLKNMNFTSLRFSTACGVSSKIRMDLVMNDFVASAVANKEINLLSNGKSWRPLIDVKDMCKAMAWAVKRKFDKKNQYLCLNVGRNQNNILISQLAYLVKKQFKGKIKVNLNKQGEVDKRSYKVNFDKYNKLVEKKYKITTSLETSIKNLKKFMIKNKFKTKNFRESKFSRLFFLKKLIKEKKINKNLYWLN